MKTCPFQVQERKKPRSNRATRARAPSRLLERVDSLDNRAVAGPRSGRAYNLRERVALMHVLLGAPSTLSKSSCRPVLTRTILTRAAVHAKEDMTFSFLAPAGNQRLPLGQCSAFIWKKLQSAYYGEKMRASKPSTGKRGAWPLLLGALAGLEGEPLDLAP